MLTRMRGVLSCLLITCGGAASALAAAPIGSAVAVQDVVTGELARSLRNIGVGDRVLEAETLEVSRTGSGEFKLDDETKLALGAGARLTLDRFVYDPRRASGSIALNFMTGAFRFVTGIASKSAYVLRLPSASITVRGTVFDIFVEGSGRSWLLLHEGGVQVCNARGGCRIVSKPGTLIRIDEDGALSKPSRWASLTPHDISFDEAFPFVSKPPSIDPTPTFTRDALLAPDAPTAKKRADAPAVDERPRPKRTKTAAASPGSTADDDVLSPPKSRPRLPRDLPRASEYIPSRKETGGYVNRLLKTAETYAPKIVARVRNRSDDDDGDTHAGTAPQRSLDPYRTPGTTGRPKPRPRPGSNPD